MNTGVVEAGDLIKRVVVLMFENRFYAPLLFLFCHQRSPQNPARYHHLMGFYQDAAGLPDKVPRFAFIEPAYLPASAVRARGAKRSPSSSPDYRERSGPCPSGSRS